MISPSGRRDLIDRLRYTFMASEYGEIDVLINGLTQKENFEELCEEFFRGCRIDTKGYLLPSGFFADDSGSSSLLYAMYEILGRSPDDFILKHRVTRVRFLRRDLGGKFRLPNVVFSLPRLEALVIRGIGISRLPEDLGKAKNLRILDLAFNRLSKFPDSILTLRKLSALNLSNNRLERLPENLGRLKRLRILNLRANALTELPKDWHRLQELRILDLSMNRLSSVPDSLRTVVSLKDLRLAYNDMPASEEASWEKGARDEPKGSQGSLGLGS
jgi:hypothetical protein